jgi:hypothetical protein
MTIMTKIFIYIRILFIISGFEFQYQQTILIPDLIIYNYLNIHLPALL